MSKFMPGDRVMCIEALSYRTGGFSSDKIYTILTSDQDNPRNYEMVTLYDDDGDHRRRSADEFEIYDSPRATIMDAQEYEDAMAAQEIMDQMG